ncbi:MAG: epimerase [Thermoprotei archaeon]|nr:MAG: epimerase [Thermoprotei archaeon]
MSVLVTGGAGYIGSALVSELLDNGYEVISIDDLSRGDYRHLEDRANDSRLKPIVGDICDIVKLEKIVKEAKHVDAIFHLAAVPGLKLCQANPLKAIMTNICGTYNVLEVAKKFKIDKVIFTSSAAVYGDPLKVPLEETHPKRPKNLYGITKLAAELLLINYYQEHNLPIVILRLGNVYGLGLFTYWESVIPKFVRQALSGEALTIFGTGEQTRDFIHVQDVVKALKLALDAEDVAGEIFNVGTGEPVSVNTVAEMVSKIAEEELNIRPEITYLKPRKGDILTPGFCLCVDKIKKRLKFKPTWHLEAGIRQLVKHFLSLRTGP